MVLNKEIKIKPIVVIIFLLTSLVLFVCFYGKDFLERQALNYKYITTKATIIDIKKSYEESGQVMYTPIYEYTVDGKKYNYKNKYSTGIRLEIGDTKRIKYNPENPNESFLVSFGDWFLFLVFADLFVVIAIILSANNKFKRLNEIAQALVITLIGIMLYYYLSYEANTYDPIVLIKHFHFAFISYLFILIGIIAIIGICYNIFKKKAA